MGKAVELQRNAQHRYRGHVRLFELEPPLTGPVTGESHKYVAVSAVDIEPFFGGAVPRTIETFIFPATKHGDIADYGELPGSIRGSLDHLEALREAGYEEIVELP